MKLPSISDATAQLVAVEPLTCSHSSTVYVQVPGPGHAIDASSISVSPPTARATPDVPDTNLSNFSVSLGEKVRGTLAPATELADSMPAFAVKTPYPPAAAMTKAKTTTNLNAFLVVT